MQLLNVIGWLATAVFVSSYFFKTPARLRLVQALAALLWIGYGVLIHAMPVIVSNVIVSIAAVASILRERTPQREPALDAQD